MVHLKICVGSSCHLRGAEDVIAAMKALVDKYRVSDKVALEATFCLGQCLEGVNVVTSSADELVLHHVTPANAEDLFRSEVLPRL